MLNPVVQSAQWSYLELLHFFGPRILFAVICGGLLGLERELKNKPAGIKTNILISLGSTLYTSMSLLISTQWADTDHFGDPARIAAQIVTGIGFLGGGAIIQTRGTILGLTTAATIWVVAALGICIGLGHGDVALVMSILVILVMVLSNLFEDRVLGRSLTFACEIVADDPDGKIRFSINHALARNNLNLDDFDMAHRNHMNVMTCRYSGHRNDHKKFVLELWNTPGIKEVRQL
jgi:putative Mg2+ transporter-C (MgtC) family protein